MRSRYDLLHKIAEFFAPVHAGEPPALLAANILSSHLGVPLAWLAPVRHALQDMIAAAENDRMDDAALRQFLTHATDRLPELFDRMDIGGLAAALLVATTAFIPCTATAAFTPCAATTAAVAAATVAAWACLALTVCTVAPGPGPWAT